MKSKNVFFRLILAIGLLSSATLLFETALTRVLAVAQFYHFAFLVVSLALLGFGASGTILSLFPQIKDQPLEKILTRVGFGFFLSIWVTYAVVNWLPFDSYSIAWERRQIIYFVLYYFSLSLPFLVSGLGLGTALAVIEKKHNLVYAASLIGSGLGVILAPGVLGLSGILGVMILCAGLGLGCWLVMSADWTKTKLSRIGTSLFALLALIVWITLSIFNIQGKSPISIKISPYKGLAYARQFPGAELIFGKWNASSRIDVMANAGTRRFPGLSYAYTGVIPAQFGLSVDGDTLQPITLAGPEEFPAGKWLPEWWAFSIHPDPDILVLDPGAGFAVLQALAESPNSITTVLKNRLILEAVQETALGYSVFNNPDVEVILGNQRAVLQRTDDLYDVVYLPLIDSYQPVTNGVYSISENYSLTEEGIRAGLSRLSPGGIFVGSRWLQNPPSEGLRLVSTIYQALESLEVQNLEDTLVIYRGIQTITVVVKPTGWEKSELTSLRDFLERCRFDLVWAPDLTMDELNRWNRLSEPIYHQRIKELFQASERGVYYESYSFDITPPRDDYPFFFHFFTWSQAPHILESLGKTWQPFGGSGFFLLIFLLVLVILLSSVMILIPLWLGGMKGLGHNYPGKIWALLYFALIGIGFMFVEIPLISQWGLFLNSPILAFSFVVGVILLSSGLGSMTVDQTWCQKDLVQPLLFILGGGFVLFSSMNKELILSWPIWFRYLASCLGFFPLGFAMGSFFPQGISWINRSYPGMVPWAWAVNGSVSVIASVVTAILSIQVGYPLVLILGGVSYLGAWMINRFRLI